MTGSTIGLGTDTDGCLRRLVIVQMRVWSRTASMSLALPHGISHSWPCSQRNSMDPVCKWYHATADLPPKILLTLYLLPTEDTPQKKGIQDFAKDLETHL